MLDLIKSFTKIVKKIRLRTEHMETPDIPVYV